MLIKLKFAFNQQSFRELKLFSRKPSVHVVVITSHFLRTLFVNWIVLYAFGTIVVFLRNSARFVYF